MRGVLLAEAGRDAEAGAASAWPATARATPPNGSRLSRDWPASGPIAAVPLTPDQEVVAEQTVVNERRGCHLRGVKARRAQLIGSLHNRNRLNFDQILLARQAHDLHERARREVGREVLLTNLAHRRQL